MTDCPNAEIRDLLPDYLHEQLPAADAAIVEHHVASCAECANELALLRMVMAVRPNVPVNVARIVASLPKPGAVAEVSPVHDDRAGVRAISSAPSAKRRGFAMQQWRAAAVTLVALGGLSVAIARRGLVSVTDAPPVNDSAMVASGGAAAVSNESLAVVPAIAGSAKAPALSVGELSDYSDAELESVIQRLEKWDGAAAAEPLPGVPLLPAGSGGVR